MTILSYAVSMQQTGFESVGYGDWRNIGNRMSELGFEGIELAIRNPFEVDLDLLRNFLLERGLLLSAVGTGQAYFDEGLSLSSPDAAKREKAILYLKKHIEIASQFGAVVIIGLIRGRLAEHGDPEEALKLFSRHLAEIDTHARDCGVELAIEPINRYETDLLNTAKEATRHIVENNLQQTGILLDTFHMNIEESSWENSILSAGEYLKHIHFADSNRLYPGAGHIDFPNIVNLLNRAAYHGFISGEMLPKPDLNTSITKFYEYMREI